MSAAFCGRSVSPRPELIGRFGPFERLGILVVPINESADIGLEFPD
jgi:hypothetical protein